jgi:hypothetical protein
MAERSTGKFHPAAEITVLTCDVCERDVGYEDGRRPRAYLRVTRHPNAGGLDDQSPAIIVCSRDCLSAYAAALGDLDRDPGHTSGGGTGSSRKPRPGSGGQA